MMKRGRPWTTSRWRSVRVTHCTDRGEWVRQDHADQTAVPLYDPTHGAITVEGVDLRESSNVALPRQISVYSGLCPLPPVGADNVWYGNMDLAADDERNLAAAASRSRTRSWHAAQGYATILGKWFERGEELSVASGRR